MLDATVKQLLTTGLATKAAEVRHQVRRPLGILDRKIVAQYLADAPEPKLHIGCGDHLLPGWLNTDFHPRRRDVMHLDATRQFPFSSGTFDCVFSEHVIEHIPYSGGMKMLSECRRILKPSGTIRISTPDLAFLFDLSKPDRSELQERYIKTASAEIPDASGNNPVFVINNFVRNWGHTFIYDEATLRDALHQAGFKNVLRVPMCESEHISLCNLENESRSPPGFLRLETLTLEAN